MPRHQSSESSSSPSSSASSSSLSSSSSNDGSSSSGVDAKCWERAWIGTDGTSRSSPCCQPKMSSSITEASEGHDSERFCVLPSTNPRRSVKISSGTYRFQLCLVSRSEPHVCCLGTLRAAQVVNHLREGITSDNWEAEETGLPVQRNLILSFR